MSGIWSWLCKFGTESAEENVEQDDAMEKSDDDSANYVSCYPNTRRYSLANAMATNRPLYRTDNQGYSVDMGSGEADDKEEKKETRIDIPTSQPPQYSSVHEKMADKKVKVCSECTILWVGNVLFWKKEMFLILLKSDFHQSDAMLKIFE